MVRTSDGNSISIEIDGADITKPISNYLDSITIIDNKEGTSDSVTLTLTDPLGELNKPSRFKTMRVIINNVCMGEFEINSIGGDIHGSTIDITGTSLPMTNSLRKARSESYSNVSMKDMVNIIASRNGLQGVVDEGLSGVTMEQVNQVKESDINLIKRLSSDAGGSMKITRDKLVVMDRDNANKVNGQPLPVMPIHDPTLTSGSWEEKSSEADGTIKACWLNELTNIEVYESDGEGEPVRELPDRYSTQEECKKAIKSARGLSDKSEVDISLTMPLNVNYIAGCQADVQNHHSMINGLCEIESITHTLSVSSYDQTDIKMVKKTK